MLVLREDGRTEGKVTVLDKRVCAIEGGYSSESKGWTMESGEGAED